MRPVLALKRITNTDNIQLLLARFKENEKQVSVATIQEGDEKLVDGPKMKKKKKILKNVLKTRKMFEAIKVNENTLSWNNSFVDKHGKSLIHHQQGLNMTINFNLVELSCAGVTSTKLWLTHQTK